MPTILPAGTMTLTTAPSTATRGADLIQTMLSALDGLASDGGLAPSHRERVSSAEEACRLVADAASESPRSLRAGSLATLRRLLTRLAAEVETPSRESGAFGEGSHLSVLDAAHGSLPAALHGLAAALGVVEAGVPGGRGATAPGAEGLGRVNRAEARDWVRGVNAALSGLEREVLRAPASPALRRDAWCVACSLAVAAAQVSDNACIDIGPALERLSEAGANLAQAAAVLSSEAAAAGSGLSGAQGRAVLALVPVVDAGMAMVGRALAARESARPHVAWRLLSRGRSDLGPRQVDALLGCAVAALPHGGAGASVHYVQALARAAREYQVEWSPQQGACA